MSSHLLDTRFFCVHTRSAPKWSAIKQARFQQPFEFIPLSWLYINEKGELLFMLKKQIKRLVLKTIFLWNNMNSWLFCALSHQTYATRPKMVTAIYCKSFKLGNRERPTASGRCSTEAVKGEMKTQDLPCRFRIRPAYYISPLRHGPQWTTAD